MHEVLSPNLGMGLRFLCPSRSSGKFFRRCFGYLETHQSRDHLFFYADMFRGEKKDAGGNSRYKGLILTKKTYGFLECWELVFSSIVVSSLSDMYKQYNAPI